MILDFVGWLSGLSRARKRTSLGAYRLAAMGADLWAAFFSRLGLLDFSGSPAVAAARPGSVQHLKAEA